MLHTLPEHVRSLASNDFMSFGVDNMAYVKRMLVDGHYVHSVHAADGTPLTVLTERDKAFATIRQHELEPVSVH
jgi:hypothetical protein